MINILAILSAMFLGKEIIKEKAEPVAPKGTRFDWDEYWADVRRGMSSMEQIKKRQRGGYMTTKPLPQPKEVIPMVVDIERYNRDKKMYGKELTEVLRKRGQYTYIRK